MKAYVYIKYSKENILQVKAKSEKDANNIVKNVSDCSSPEEIYVSLKPIDGVQMVKSY